MKDVSEAGLLLDKLSVEDIEAAANELHAYAAHRRAVVPASGAAKAPFNFSNFLKNFVKVVQAIWPVIEPTLAATPGLDTSGVQSAPAPSRQPNAPAVKRPSKT